MRWRRWVCILAVLGMFAHALAIVRHNGVVLSEAVSASSTLAVNPALQGGSGELAADLTQICTAAHGMAGQPGGSNTSCPICCGLAAAFVVPVQSTHLAVRMTPSVMAHWATEDERSTVHRRIRPPSRAPPFQA